MPRMPYTVTDLGELSRQKLRRADSHSGDTLRRAVLILNVMRSTEYLNAIEENHYEQQEPQQASYYSSSSRHQDVDVEMTSLEDDNDVSHHHHHQYIFPTSTSPSSKNLEQDWLDSILDDLEYDSDTHVSVVEAMDEEEDHFEQNASEQEDIQRHLPLFTTTTTPLYSVEPESPPTSPPGLDVDTIDSDSEDDEEADYANPAYAVPPSDTYFFSNLPFHPRICHPPLL